MEEYTHLFHICTTKFGMHQTQQHWMLWRAIFVLLLWVPFEAQNNDFVAESIKKTVSKRTFGAMKEKKSYCCLMWRNKMVIQICSTWTTLLCWILEKGQRKGTTQTNVVKRRVEKRDNTVKHSEMETKMPCFLLVLESVMWNDGMHALPTMQNNAPTLAGRKGWKNIQST